MFFSHNRCIIIYFQPVKKEDFELCYQRIVTNSQLLNFSLQKLIQYRSQSFDYLMKTSLKSDNRIHLPILATKAATLTINEEYLTTFQTHSLRMDLKSDQQQEIYGKILHFLQDFLTNTRLREEITDHATKDQQSSFISSKVIPSKKKSEKQISFKKMEDSKICLDAQTTHLAETCIVPQKKQPAVGRRYSKKISIFVEEEQPSSSSEGSSDSIITSTSVKTIRSIEISHIDLNFDTLSLIFDIPSPFLINLSLCLFVKYCFHASKTVLFQQCAWILCISTVIAYKTYYDEVLEGLVDYFSTILKVSSKDLIDLQRCFCEQIGYSTLIRGYDYHFIMAKLVTIKTIPRPLQ